MRRTPRLRPRFMPGVSGPGSLIRDVGRTKLGGCAGVEDKVDTNSQTKGSIMKTSLGLAVGLLLTASLGMAGEQVSDVAFVLGPKHFSDANAIIIEHVAATSPNFAVGDKVTVRGRYTFTSEEKAQLCLYLTTSGDAGPEPVAPTQRAEVRKGSGTFELT